jgi:hypothetical protein
VASRELCSSGRNGTLPIVSCQHNPAHYVRAIFDEQDAFGFVLCFNVPKLTEANSSSEAECFLDGTHVAREHNAVAAESAALRKSTWPYVARKV